MGFTHGDIAAQNRIRRKEDRRLLGLIKESFDASQGIYGSRRIFCDLREVGETCGVRRVARILCEHCCLRGYRKHRYKYGKPAQAAPNRLSQQFEMQSLDDVWVTDITYILTL